MHSDLSAQSIAAIATVVAALISGALSFVNLTLNKEQKTSEFRQAWIDALREDLAAFFAGSRAFARASEELQALGKGAPLAMTAERISEIRYQVAETFYRIKLRLNPTEDEHKELLRLMQMAIQEQNNKGDTLKTLKAIETAAEFVPQILKTEWKRVKEGELAFRVVRNWVAPLIVLFSLAFVVLVWAEKIKI